MIAEKSHFLIIPGAEAFGAEKHLRRPSTAALLFLASPIFLSYYISYHVVDLRKRILFGIEACHASLTAASYWYFEILHSLWPKKINS